MRYYDQYAIHFQLESKMKKLENEIDRLNQELVGQTPTGVALQAAIQHLSTVISVLRYKMGPSTAVQHSMLAREYWLNGDPTIAKRRV